MPPKRAATKDSRITKKTAAPTRPSLPRAAKSKSRYRTRTQIKHVEDETSDDQEAEQTNKEEPPITSPPSEKAIPPLLTNQTITTPNDPKIEKPKTPTTRILQQEEDLAAKADAVWALHRHHNHSHNQSPISSPLRHHTPSLNASRRNSSSSSSSNEPYPGPPLADPRLSPTSNRRLLTERAKFAARWAADVVAQSEKIPLEEYTIPKRRPGVLKGGEGGEDEDGDGDEVERWRPEKPVWESVVSEEDMRIWRRQREDFERAWREYVVAQREGVSLFDYTRRVPKEKDEDAGIGLLDHDSTNSKTQNKTETRWKCGRRTKETKGTWRGDGEKGRQSCGSGLNMRRESLESSNSGGSLFSGTSPRLPLPHEGASPRQSSPEKQLEAESSSSTGSVEAPTTLQARLNSTSPEPILSTHSDDTEPSPKPGTFFIASPLKPLFSDNMLKGKTVKVESPPEVGQRSSGSDRWSADWSTNLFCREELAIMIDHSVENVHLDCPHCDLVIREGFPIPLPFVFKEKCVCTYPQLQAQGYRAQMKPNLVSGRRLKGKDKVALGDVEFENAVEEKKRVIGEVIDRNEEEMKMAARRENDIGHERSKITCAIRRGKMNPAKREASMVSGLGVDSSSSLVRGREVTGKRGGEETAPPGVEKKRKGSSTTKNTSTAVKKTKISRKR